MRPRTYSKGFATGSSSDRLVITDQASTSEKKPFEYFLGRMPVLEPFWLYGSVGIGLSSVEVETTDNVSSGMGENSGFAYQFGGGVSYDITDWTTFSIGYRYLDLGEVDTELSFGLDPFGTHSLDLESHEFVTSLRIDFYSMPLADMAPHNWKRPEWTRGWSPRKLIPKRWRRDY